MALCFLALVYFFRILCYCILVYHGPVSPSLSAHATAQLLEECTEPQHKWAVGCSCLGTASRAWCSPWHTLQCQLPILGTPIFASQGAEQLSVVQHFLPDCPKGSSSIPPASMDSWSCKQQGWDENSALTPSPFNNLMHGQLQTPFRLPPARKAKARHKNSSQALPTVQIITREARHRKIPVWDYINKETFAQQFRHFTEDCALH